MKAFASKERESRSAVLHETEHGQPQFELNLSASKASFRGWIHSVASIANVRALPLPSVYKVPRLTASDVSRVNHATIREGESHCVWPPSVIQEFNKAEVITRGEVSHYVLLDASLTRVEYQNRSRQAKPVLQMCAERD